MRVLFAGHKERGVQCLRAVQGAGHQVIGIVAHAPGAGGSVSPLVAEGRRLNVPVFQPSNVNEPSVLSDLRVLKPEIVVLAGYGPIVGKDFIGLAPKGCVNLHGGKLPECRGSSPMNWAIMNGEKTFTLSVIRVDAGVDTGDVLLDRTFKLDPKFTIKEVQDIANDAFPQMLVKVLGKIATGNLKGRKQRNAKSAYFPLRFPDDGFILWDTLTAEQIHNRIRALTDPYPGAFTFYKERKVKLLGSRLTERPFHGEPGRLYQKKNGHLLICASDRCLWIERSVFEDTGEDLSAAIQRYERLPTLREAALRMFGPKPVVAR